MTFKYTNFKKNVKSVMVNYLKEFNDDLDNFLTIDVKFDSKYNQYLFHNIWTSELTTEYFKRRVNKLENSLWKHLKYGLNNKEFLSDTRDKIRNTFTLFCDEDYSEFDFFKKSGVKIRSSSISHEPPSKEKYDYNYFKDKSFQENYYDENFLKQDKEVINYHNHLVDLFKYEGRQPDEAEFEQSKLLYFVITYQDCLFRLLNVVESLFFDCDKINFSTINIEDYLVDSSEDNQKCHVNLNKLKTAQLFSFLINEGYLFINTDNVLKNETQLKRFVEKNFTYRRDGSNIQNEIKNINKEFSEIIWYQKASQIELLDELISKLEARKKKVEGFT